MRLRVTVALPLVIGLALIAVQAGRQWINSQVAARVGAMKPNEGDKTQAIKLATLVVATRPLQFGSPLSAADLKVIAWPQASLPKGGFANVADLLKSHEPRVVLSTIEPDEPVLASKISGRGRRASLAALIQPGKTAITIRVDEVIGVAGFVAPGDRVDVLLTRRVAGAQPVTDVVQHDLKVLAVDQTVDNPTAKPTVAHAVTLEASTEQAEKLALAASIGNLTLALRPLGSSADDGGGRVTVADLGSKNPTARTDRSRSVTVTVIRNATRQDYSVPALQ